jgi:hypothetical protein
VTASPVQTSVHSGIDPQALTLEETARLLSAAGGKKITAAQIQADVDAGAPQRPDGRMNLVHYAAWLARQVQGEGGGH